MGAAGGNAPGTGTLQAGTVGRPPESTRGAEPRELLLGHRGAPCEIRGMEVAALGPVSWERMEQGIEQVRRRLERAARALAGAGVPYAVVGGNAVAAWVSRVDVAAVRNTRDVDLLLDRPEFGRAKEALETAGFVHRRVSSLGKAAGMDVFLDGPGARVRDAIHILWAGERATPDAVAPNPSLGPTDSSGGFALVSLEDLVRMKLASFRDKDRMHLRDLAGVGLIDEDWLPGLAPALAERLRRILEDPEG